jgi:hypothetical protein
MPLISPAYNQLIVEGGEVHFQSGVTGADPDKHIATNLGLRPPRVHLPSRNKPRKMWTKRHGTRGYSECRSIPLTPETLAQYH